MMLALLLGLALLATSAVLFVSDRLRDPRPLTRREVREWVRVLHEEPDVIARVEAELR